MRLRTRPPLLTYLVLRFIDMMARQKAIKKVENPNGRVLDPKVPVSDRYSHLPTRPGDFVNASIQPHVSGWATVTAVNQGDTVFILCGSADYQDGCVVLLFW